MMFIKSGLLKIIAKMLAVLIRKWSDHALEDQEKILNMLVARASKTKFGKDHNFDKIQNYDDFKKFVPVRDYEELRPYFDRITQGESDILWPGKPKYLAKTSGTTSGIKFIPVTEESVLNHTRSTRNAIFNYMAQKNDISIFEGKMIFLSGSPELEIIGGIPTGRLSGIVNHEIPVWIRSNQLPSVATNCIEDWEEKLERIIDETLQEDMRVIGGIPPWVQMYFERLLQRSDRNTVMEVFPNFSLFIYGGVNYEPYRASLEKLIGKKIDSIEYFPASEGFFAYQDELDAKDLLLTTRSGIFYEFIPLQEAGSSGARRLSLAEVETGIDYALVVSNNAGLFAYDVGDAVRFTSLKPYKLLVTGRVKHYISAFGEHVIGKEVEVALQRITAWYGIKVVEFTVAPQVSPPESGLPYHEWFVEFAEEPNDLDAFAVALNEEMTNQNIYYKDLIEGKILRPLVVRSLPKTSFIKYMKKQGKLGGQNKVPRLSNDRNIVQELMDNG